MANVTIKDVARMAQVSVATVSRALNGHGNVAAPVRARVLAAARELRYTPHAAARSLSSRRTQTIGVVLPDLYGEFFSELIRGIDQVAREHGLHLLVSSYHGDPDEQSAALGAMRGRVDGLLAMAPYVGGSEAMRADLDAALPRVLINSRPAADEPVVGVDNYGGAVAMVGHLVGQGHRRIAFLSGPEDNFDAHERLRGYRDAIARLLPQSQPWELRGEFDEASGHRAGQALLAAAPRPDAVFAANDMMALGCMFAFAQAGLRVPADIAVAGFDDIPLAGYVHPGLTTIRVNIAELGARAARLLIARIAGEAAGGSSPLATELIVRASSGARGASPS
ncbi:LacI family DNA-binding transcriptional regulator [Vulcaniibacterium tengchongense]|uniref:LacI family transcriptional regulator n=1 Tax=Vulcaniibacterium tengchongense TaxID=1273429 RepID=A0A3N4VES7_9GAMM|nr:LacI family DNA-binding transcriptional regulator [Vulcaniibacterium tengchongense]RPE81482.1 LacI family transcriptional regulator [Vulcaniibacterium tengchongense]